jgi:C-terminal processing protease CtpA/Prc
MRGTYTLQLPARPRGTAVDVDHDGQADAGVQIFAVSYSPNLAGGPYAEGDDPSTGWPSYLASTVNDPENNDEVTGGKLIVWTPDANQQFPSGFGDDGLLFTADDPVAALPTGYAVVDLDQQPFAISQQDEQELTLYEPEDAGVKDYSNLSYTEAFKQMFAKVRTEYAFNGIPDKQPNWDELEAQLTPRVEAAERDRDPEAFYLALHDFTNAFRDGHVGLSGGQFDGQLFQQVAIGGYGFALRELDDKRVIATLVVPDGAAAAAGMTVGAEIVSFNNKPIDQAISEVQPLGGPFSTDFAKRYQQQAFLVRAPIGAEAQVTFRNKGQADKSATLRATDERDSYFATSLYADYNPDALPVEFRTLDSGVGYVRVNSNYDDLNLIVRLFERALRTFENNQVPGVIIDMRLNSGGAPLGLAGFLTDEEIPLAQLEYYSDKTGGFEPEGTPDKLRPNQEQYRFDKLALLTDQTCASACEIEAYGFSQAPGMMVIGQYPTAGVEAEVARGQFQLPEGISLQVPTGRFVLPDGSIFLEGKGVQPTQRVPINEQTVLSSDDVVLQTAEQAILGQ